ncbi:sensor histidine kinase [Mycobacteriaceae bacterium 1482268.1]|nr:sensor histidine kinase [Mycobacteriaceae bacterium 1482268.1]
MIRIGTSGWSYDHWTDVLYPPKTPVSKRLAIYVEEFDTVELNASFYRWPRDAAFTGWRQRLPDGFTMAVKAHRGLTHFRRLNSPEPWVERFERCWKALGDRAEALLVQVHPELERDDARLDHFLALMPRSIPVAMELRHPSWNDPAVFELLKRHGAAYVVMSGAKLACVPVATSDLVYIRMHGPEPASLYTGSYSDDELRLWADRVTAWHEEGKRVDVYFNNDLGGHAVRNARLLRDLLAPS